MITHIQEKWKVIVECEVLSDWQEIILFKSKKHTFLNWTFERNNVNPENKNEYHVSITIFYLDQSSLPADP